MAESARTASSSMPRPVIFIGPIWVTPTRTMAPSRAFRSRREKSWPPSSRQAARLTPKQLHLDKDERQALLVRPRRHARDARQPRRLAHRNPRRDEPRAIPGRAAMPGNGASASPWIRSCGKFYWTQKGADNGGQWSTSSARTSNSRRAKPRPTAETSNSFIDDLPEPIDLELDLDNRVALLDRSRGSAARQYRQPRVHRSTPGPQSARDCVHPSDGRHRHRPGSFKAAGCSSPTLPARSIAPISTAQEQAQLPLRRRATSPASPTPKSEHLIQRRTDHDDTSLFAASPSSALASLARAGPPSSSRTAWRSWRPMSRRMQKPP